ncbi:MAG TPA: MHYT domain-containing protein [Candidatus Acidoferrales bacterium]|jgi:two-component system, cell cycle sensor histidine kinase and response regulator CckA
MLVDTAGHSINAALSGSYDLRLVELSVVIAMCASYAALDLAGRVTASKSFARGIWLMGGATAMGLGIWSMHYIGMLAFKLPVPVEYDWPTVVLSLIAAILASSVALFVVSRKKMGVWRAAAGSIPMGLGIAVMHYSGMEAMRLTAMCHYDAKLVALSVLLAVVISFVALCLAFISREEKQGMMARKVASAVVMGAAIPVMHYTGMAAASFMPTNTPPNLSHSISITALGTSGIVMVTMAVLGIAIVSSLFDRRYSAQTLELESAEQRYRLLFERSLAGIMRTTLDGPILDCNQACARILGYASREELMASPVDAHYFDPEDRNTFIAKLKKENSLSNYERCLRRKDGSPVWLLASAHLVEGKDGVPAVNEETFIDITERKKAEETFRKAFDANPEPMTISSIAEGRYIDVNEAFLRATGYAREEVIGHTSLEINFWEKPETRTELVNTLRTEGSVRNLEIAYRTKSGEQRVALDSSEIIEVGGQKCVISILRDMTEQKSLEKQLRQAQKMEAVGQLTGGIAHDFNNMLGVIIGYSEVVTERLAGNEPLQRKCEQITKAAQSAASLTRQLLAFSRQQVLEPKFLDLNSIVRNMEKMLRRLIGEDITFSTGLGPTLGSIKADQGQIEQVIINLVVNARDAMPHGGKVRIETSAVELSGEYSKKHLPQLPGSYVLLTVSDTGMGMDSETQARIFEPFFTTKEVGKGTGLGLSTVYGVVRQFDGHIWVYSEPGQGTTFKIYLPRTSQAPAVMKSNNRLASTIRGSETILLVEDEEALRELTRSLLDDQGYKVLEAARPERAIEIAKQYKDAIDLLLTDMVMPGMNGRVLADTLASIRPDMKVVFMSGYTGFNHAALTDAKVTLLSKPFTKDNLLSKLQEVLGFSAQLETVEK